MAEIEQVGLLIDGDTLYGVAASSGVPSKVQSWRFSSGAVAPEEVQSSEFKVQSSDEPTNEPLNEPTDALSDDSTIRQSDDSTKKPSLAEALASAREALHAEDGCVLALPPDELVAKIISLPPVEPDAIGAMVRLQMEKFAPVSGDALEVASEVVGATEDSTRVFAVAMPMAKLDALAENLAASDVRVSRIDSSLLCEWRMYCDCAAKPEIEGCHAILFVLPSGRCDLIIADSAGPVFARSLGSNHSSESLVRELVLSILNLGEDFAGLAPERLVYVADTPPADDLPERVDRALGVGVDWLNAAEVGPYVEGVIRRDSGEGHIDIVPPAWRDVEKQSIARGRFMTGVAVALIIWAVLAAALFLVPRFMQRRLDALDSAIAAVQPAYRTVSDTRTKVRLIRSYQDRSHSLLDVLRTICAEMPEGITFSSISYEKGGETPANSKTRVAGGVKIVGDADSSTSVLAFKDVLDASGLFAPAKLNGPTLDVKRQRYRFEIDSRFIDEEGGQ
jgi:Tfp pilus assembly protein PilN